jgi:hypothetical protein
MKQKTDIKIITELHRRYRYDPETGQFYLAIDIHTPIKKKVGDVATVKYGGTDTIYLGLCFRTEGSKVHILAHRAAWLFYYGSWPEKEIDHINGNKHDNRIVNLREVMHQENRRNSLKSRTNSTGFPGVTWQSRDKKYHGKIKYNGKAIYLGSFKNPKDAFRMRILKELELWGTLSIGTASTISEHPDLTEEFQNPLYSSTKNV